MADGKIRVAVAGANGRMGRTAVEALLGDSRFAICAKLVRDISSVTALEFIPTYDDAMVLCTEQKPDVWLDLTDANHVVGHVDTAISLGIRPVVGATGYTEDDVLRWEKTCAEAGIGGIAAPNFAVGALLMMRFAQEAAKIYQHAEIIELHHDGKKDKPSGTARRTSQLMSANLGHAPEIHSVRLPGLVAHQEVIFGGAGEVLTIRHDSMDRKSFVSGILLACEKASTLPAFVYGLEHVLW